MLPLTKVRLKMLKSKQFCCSLSFYIVFLFLYALIIIYISKENIPIKIYNNNVLQDVDLLSIDNYSKLLSYLEKTSLIVNDKDIGEKLRIFIESKVHKNIEINNYNMENQIIVDYNKNEDSYIFSYAIKDKNYEEQIFPFKNSLLSASEAKDLFISINPKDLKELYKDNLALIENFILYQSLLSNFMINQKSNIVQQKNIKFQFGFNSYPPSVEIKNKAFLNMILIYINIGFFYISSTFTFQLFSEKQLKIDIMLNGLGISKASSFLSWIIDYFFLNSFLVIITYIKFSFILNFSHFFVLFYFFLFLINSFLWAYIIITSFKDKIGMILYSIINIFPFLISYTLVDYEIIPILKFILSLFPITNLTYSIQAIIKYQTIQEMPISIMTINVGGTSLLINIIILIIEIIVLSLIFIASIKKNELGLSFADFIKYIFTKRRPNILVKNIDKIYDNENNIPINHEELSDINKALKQENNCLKIQNIYKEYNDVKAVDNFNGELFKNEIFVLLGHNGAGKTTLIKMISGTEAPTGGDILLNNESLIVNRNLLYQNLGVCFQEDIFFQFLTVEQQLKFMIEIKKDKYDQEQVDNLLRDLDLIEKKKQMCLNLSGGEKRKLCIALALIGNSKIVLLDEPTSGLDVLSRRKLWDFLKGYKKDKIIVLTTHSLEEAEYLGDRIGIMNNGKFVCSGSSSYLKEKYTHGFYLNLIVDNKIFTEEVKKELYDEITKYDPDLRVKISSKNQYSFILNSNNENIDEIFNKIEENKENYGIEDYNISSSSLEEVFLKVNNNILLSKDDNKNKINNDNEALEIKNLDSNISMSIIDQVIVQLKRLFLGLWRQKKSNLLELLYCLLLFYVYLLIMITINVPPVSKNNFNLINLLKSNEIFTNDIKYFEPLNIKSIKFKEIKSQETIEQFTKEIYNSAYLNIGKAGIHIKKVNENEILFYNTEIPINKTSYIISDIMLSVSSFLKNEYGINAIIFPEITYTNENNIDTTNILTSLYLGIMAPIPCTFYICFIMADIIKEKKSGMKQLLYLSGVNMFSYWLSYFVLHFSKLFLLYLFISLGIFLVNDAWLYIFCLLILSSFSSLFFFYLLTKHIEKEEMVMNFFSFSIIIITIIGGIIVLIFDIDLQDLLVSPDYNILDILPMISQIKGFLSFTLSYYSRVAASNIRILKTISIQLLNSIIYLVIFILTEKDILEKGFNYIKVKYFIKNSNITFSNEQINEEFLNDNNMTKTENCPLLQDSTQNEIDTNINNDNDNDNDNDNYKINSNLVNKERNRIIEDTNNNQIPTKIVGLQKTYWFCCKKNIRAINKIYFGLEDNEKFGLLGFNGSGKTTLFKSITKEIFYDSGLINISNKNIDKHFNEIRKTIGYCPQENPLLDFMKVREMIAFFLDLKEIPDTVENICKKFSLENYIDTYCENLSGGNKRKLSFALALMGQPRILLLDEPSTGVDPESRRIMWKNIINLNKKKKHFNMILTTHSMEEAEILTDRICWLKSGSIITIGNPEKLKMLLSTGYNLHIKFVHLSDEINNEIIIDEETKNELCSIIKDFDKQNLFINENPNINPYLKELLNLIKQFKDNFSEIVIKNINKDFSFDFNMKIIKEKKKTLFTKLLSLKKENKNISQIDISNESLENILTKI